MNTIIKNLKRQWLIPVVAMAALAASSCKKTLEVAPYSSLTDATAFSSVDRVEAAVNGVYDAAQSGFYAGGAVRGYPFGAASVAQGDMRGEDDGTHEEGPGPDAGDEDEEEVEEDAGQEDAAC